MAKQLELPFISRELEKTSVNQRVTDGFINATEICKAAGKNFADYTRTQNTKDFLEALSADMGIPITEEIVRFYALFKVVHRSYRVHGWTNSLP